MDAETKGHQPAGTGYQERRRRKLEITRKQNRRKDSVQGEEKKARGSIKVRKKRATYRPAGGLDRRYEGHPTQVHVQTSRKY